MAETQPNRGPGPQTGQRPRGGPPRLPRRDVHVDEVIDLTPRLRRVVAAGDLQAWPMEVPGGHFKLFVPGADGEMVMRTYTVRRYDPEAGLLTIDFAIHPGGTATTWVKSVAVGDRFQVSGQARRGYLADPESTYTVFVADQSALPAVATALELLPAGHHARALIEIPTDADRIELPTPAELEIDWIIESGAPCQALVKAALALELPGGDGEVWVGCEADAMREVRRDLLHARGLSPRSIHTRAYWKQSVSNHSDHDTGDDVD